MSKFYVRGAGCEAWQVLVKDENTIANISLDRDFLELTHAEKTFELTRLVHLLGMMESPANNKED